MDGIDKFNNVFSFVKLLFCMPVLLLWINLCNAGSEGTIVMAYYFDSPLDADLNVSINTDGDNHCMYDYKIKGSHEFTIPAGTIGLYELNKENPIKYQAKSSSSGGDLCATDQSYFHVEVNAADSRYSFTSPLLVNTGNWIWPNSAKLFFSGEAANQTICIGHAYCTKKFYEYHYTNKPSLDVIYRPSY